jgi:hypothetical protein
VEHGAHVAPEELDLRRQGSGRMIEGAMPLGQQTVENADRIARFQQRIGRMKPDESGPPGTSSRSSMYGILLEQRNDDNSLREFEKSANA